MFKQILQYATEKLHMSSAARRLFDAHGQEIYRSEDIQSNQEYYVSSGENFKDPYKFIQSNDRIRLHPKNLIYFLCSSK